VLVPSILITPQLFSRKTTSLNSERTLSRSFPTFAGTRVGFCMMRMTIARRPLHGLFELTLLARHFFQRITSLVHELMRPSFHENRSPSSSGSFHPRQSTFC